MSIHWARNRIWTKSEAHKIISRLSTWGSKAEEKDWDGASAVHHVVRWFSPASLNTIRDGKNNKHVVAVVIMKRCILISSLLEFGQTCICQRGKSVFFFISGSLTYYLFWLMGENSSIFSTNHSWKSRFLTVSHCILNHNLPSPIHNSLFCK